MLEQLKTINQCRKVNEAGLENVLTARNFIKSGMPSKPPKNYSKYRLKLENILESCQPSIIAIEYKETSRNFYSGKPKEYKKQLEIACKIAKKKGIRCTNGGITSDFLAVMTYANYIKEKEHDKADDFSERAIDSLTKKIMTGKTSDDFLDRVLDKSEKFLTIYRDIPIDFLNIHWNIDDAQALEEVVTFLKKRVKKKIITTEIKRPMNDKKAKKLIERVVELEFPCVMWYFPVEAPNSWAIVNNNGELRDPFYNLRSFIYKRFVRIARISNKRKEAIKIKNKLKNVYKKNSHS